MSGEVTSTRFKGNGIKANSKDHYQAALGPLYNQRVIDAIDHVNVNTISEVYERRCDVFLLHDGENLEVIKGISSALQDRCLRVYSGIPQLNDFQSFSNENLYEQVISAVGRAHCVVICITPALVRHIENVIPTTHAANVCQMAFTYAKQHTGLSHMVPVVMSKDMRDSTLWGGQIGRVASGKVRVDLSDKAKFNVRMSELHNLILLTNGSSIHQALFNLHETAPSIAPLSKPTATPNKSSVQSTTVLINTAEELHVIEKGKVKDLADFVIANTTMSEVQAYELARKLVFNGVGSVEKLEKKALRSETYLNAFLSDPDDVKELRFALEMENTYRIMQPRSNAFVHESAGVSACAQESTATSEEDRASNSSLSSSSSYRSSYPYKFVATDYEDVFQLYVRSRIYGKADAKKQLEELAESYASAYDYNDSETSGVGGDGYGLGFVVKGAFGRMRRDVYNLVESYGDTEQHHCEQALNASQDSIDSNAFDTPMTQTPPSTPPLRQVSAQLLAVPTPAALHRAMLACGFLANAHQLGGGAFVCNYKVAGMYAQRCRRFLEMHCVPISENHSQLVGMYPSPMPYSLTTLSSTLLGNIYIYGIGAPSQVERGIKHVQSVCRDTSVDGHGNNLAYVCEMAEVLYGFCLDRGLGVAMDPFLSVECFKRAAKRGYAVGICNQGIMYRDGKGVPKDLRESVRLFQKAADLGYHFALYNLGWMYYYGAGVSTDYPKAAEIFTALYEKGDENAAYLLGYMTVYGQGVVRDVERGKAILSFAALKGVMGAQEVLFQLG
eukprot:gene24622-29749_t